jgi:primosomal protein N' (replication factor Y)
MVQVSGRAGRFIPDGRVIVQTYRPQYETIQLAAKADMVTYYEKELKARKELGFPPFTRIIRIVFRGKSASKTRKAAADFSSTLAESMGGGAELLGPSECPLAVISGNARHQLLLRTTSFTSTHSALTAFKKEYRPPPGVYVEIDIDPVSLL